MVLVSTGGPGVGLARMNGCSRAYAPPQIRMTAPIRAGILIWGVVLAIAWSGPGQAQEPPLSPREPLIDALARAEVDSYARIDEAMERRLALPDVYDPGLYAAGATAREFRASLLGHLLWLRGAESSHLERIESLPARLAEIDTHEQYQEELVDLYETSTPERYRRIADFYSGEVAAVDQRLAFLDFLEQQGVSADPAGFVFSHDADVTDYGERVARANEIESAQDLRVSEYYAWEIEQKSFLRQFRDRL